MRITRGRHIPRWSSTLCVPLSMTAAAAVASLALSTASAHATGYTAYVTSSIHVGPGPGAVTPIVTATNIAEGAIPVGDSPVGIVITPDGKAAYIADDGDRTVTPISLATNLPDQAISLPIPIGSVGGIAAAPDSREVYVVSTSATGDDPAVTPPGWLVSISTATNTPANAMPIEPGARAIAITPDGMTAYVVNTDTSSVTPVALASGRLGTPIPVGLAPEAIAITPDGTTAYVTNQDSNTVTPITLATNRAGTAIPVGDSPRGIAIAPDGKTAYVALLAETTEPFDGSVTPISVATNTAGAPVHLGDISDPSAIAITPDGRTAYVSVSNPLGVVPITLATGAVGARISLGNDSFPGPLAITPGPRQTATSVTCQPSTVRPRHPTTCTATVTDADAGNPLVPSGLVSFASAFAGSPCTLAASGEATSTCRSTFTPAVAGSGLFEVEAIYNGDSVHASSSGQTSLTVKPPHRAHRRAKRHRKHRWT